MDKPIARGLVPIGLILLVTILAYDPLLSGEHRFLQWDDGENIVANQGIQALDLAHLKSMATSRVLGVYEPVAWLAKAVEYRLFGLNPSGFHLATLLMHCLNALLLFWIARYLFTLTCPRIDKGRLTLMSVVASLFFSIHPLRVEVVAWASGQPYALAGCFYLLCVRGYLKHCQVRKRLSMWLVLSVVCYLMAVLSKSASIILPLTLLVLDYYPLRRFELRRCLLEKVPYLVIAIGFGVLAKLATEGAQPSGMIELGLLQKVARASYALVFYLAKTIWPIELSPHYAVPPGGLSIFNPRYLMDLLLVVGLSAAVIVQRAKRPWLTVLWVNYVGVLLPALGFVQHGSPAMAADRYTYFATLGWSVLAGRAMTLKSLEGLKPVFLRSAMAALLVVLMLLTFLQTGWWRDTEVLWKYALTVDPSDTLAYNNLGFHLMEQGRNEEAARFLECAVAMSPEDVRAVLNYGVVLERLGRLGEAMGLYQRALAFAPKEPLIHFNLGNVFSRMGLKDLARQHYEQALALAPDLAGAKENLSKLSSQ